MALESSEFYMNLALVAAKQAWGMTSPNPMVGAVAVADDGKVIATGWHHKAGLPHAEVEMLKLAGERARGCHVFVTLEPCSSYGRTPPCTSALISAGVKRVVIGCLDPNQTKAGQGVEILRQAGIEVEFGVLEDECFELNRAFFKWVETKKPFVLLKMAMTLDGKIADYSGGSKWITSPPARQRVQELRRWADGIMVTGKTVRADRPSLTVREPENWGKKLYKFILTSQMSEQDLAEYFPEDSEVRGVALNEAEDWENFLLELGEQGLTALLLEGGGELAALALKYNCVDAVEFHIAPKLLCGKESSCVTSGENRLLGEATKLGELKTQMIGCDLIVFADIIKE